MPETFSAQINNILYLNGKVNYNIKEISELISQKAKLVSRIHAASVNVSGLPHVSVSEAALIKRVSTTNKNALSNEDKKYIKELSTIASLLDVHMKWSKKKHIFFEWMVIRMGYIIFIYFIIKNTIEYPTLIIKITGNGSSRTQ